MFGELIGSVGEGWPSECKENVVAVPVALRHPRRRSVLQRGDRTARAGKY